MRRADSLSRRRGRLTRSSRTEVEQHEKYFSATQWQLIWLKFRKHRWASWGLAIIVLFYFVPFFAGFFAVNDPRGRHSDLQYLPPSIVG